MPEQESEHKENIRMICKGCRKKLFPNAGRWKKPDMQFVNHVKKNFNGEHMWVKINAVQDDGVTGAVDNVPIFEESPASGTIVFVPYEEIEDVC